MAELPLSIREVGIIAVALDFAIDSACQARMRMKPGNRSIAGCDADIRELRELRKRLPVPPL